jgi:RNA polymerase primary sigma factor
MRRLLSHTEEIALAKRIERGDLMAKETLIESNLRLVHAIARTHRGRGVPYADLVQEGTVGLIRAAERFDHRHGLKFSTYAVWWIRRSMRDAIAASKVIRLPAKAIRQLAAVRSAEAQLARLGPASDERIADLTHLSVRTVRSLRAGAQVVASLEEPVGEEATTLGDLIADDRAVDPAESALVHEQHDTVRAMLRLLPARHRDVLVRHYGLDGAAAQSHEEIGRSLGVGEERSRQLERESLRRLRAISLSSSLAA